MPLRMHGAIRRERITLRQTTARCEAPWEPGMTSPKSPDAVDALVGRNIRAQRVARRVSQTALGQRLGVTFQQVQKYEQGTNRVGAGRLIAIARALDVPVMTLLHGAGDGRPGVPPPVALIAEKLPLRLVES